MGLDMYLTKKTYVKQWPHQRDDERTVVTVKRGGQPVATIRPERIAYVEEQIGYWRKANHIHAWFVEHVQGGVDECQTSYVSEPALEELLATCRAVLADPAKGPELLPTRSGFFFGDTGYDEEYRDDVRRTVLILEDVLKEGGDGDFYYRASW